MAQSKKRLRRPATTEEAREGQLVSGAMDLAEKQIAEGTASSQVITHFLKLGSTREKLEQERLRRENELLVHKTEMLASQKRVEDLYAQALDVMRTYSGQQSESQYDNEEQDYDDQNLY